MSTIEKICALLLGLLLLSCIPAVHAEPITPYPFTSTTDAERFTAITKEIRCLVCQNQNIADSNAPLANDLRQKIYLMVLDHQSTAAIQDYLVKRYGEFILLQPRLSKTTWLLWTFPVLSLGCLFMFILRRGFR